jgi:hypothetical protein
VTVEKLSAWIPVARETLDSDWEMRVLLAGTESVFFDLLFRRDYLLLIEHPPAGYWQRREAAMLSYERWRANPLNRLREPWWTARRRLSAAWVALRGLER